MAAFIAIVGLVMFTVCVFSLMFELLDGLRLPLNWIEPLLRLVFRYRDIEKKGVGLYLRRFYLTPRSRPNWWPRSWRWFRLFLHKIVRSDDDRDPHTHPWSFVSTVLGGSYREHIYFPNGSGPGGVRNYVRIARPGSILRNKAEHTHQVEIIRPVWSLVISPEATQEWGFWILDEFPGVPDRWVQWDEYLGLTGQERAEEDRMRSDLGRPAPVATSEPSVIEAGWFVDSGPVRPTIFEIERDADGRYIAEAPAYPGVIVYGRTYMEATENCLRLLKKIEADRAAETVESAVLKTAERRE